MTIPIKIIRKQDLTIKPNQLDIWNKIAKPWKTYVVKRIPIVEEFLKNKKGKILDLGCGTGRNMIPSKNIEYYAVDFSEEQLKQAKEYTNKNNIKAKFYKSEANHLPFKDNTFNHGLFIATLHCIESKEKRKKALEELYRVLKPGGQALISVWDSKDKRFNQVNNQGEIYMSWLDNNIPHMRYYYLYNKKEFINLLESVGFKILSIENKEELQQNDRFSKKNLIVKIEKINTN